MENMERKIKFGEQELIVRECYVTKSVDEKDILKISVSESEVEGDILKSLKENKSAIEYFENTDLKIAYEGYTEDFVYSYRNNIYDFEFTKVSENTLKTKKATKNIEELSDAVDMLTNDIIPSIFEQLDALKVVKKEKEGGEEDGRDDSE